MDDKLSFVMRGRVTMCVSLSQMGLESRLYFSELVKLKSKKP